MIKLIYFRSLKKAMKVIVNNVLLELHVGAKVVDAVRSYYSLINKKLPEHGVAILDKFGNPIEIDGELTSKSALIIADFSSIKSMIIS